MSKLEVDKRGNKFWYNELKQLHREDGPAIELINGSKHWYIDNKAHREGGPAFEYSNGDKFWFKSGLRHREDGPAVEYANGSKLWYYYGYLVKCSSQEEFLRLIKLKAFW